MSNRETKPNNTVSRRGGTLEHDPLGLSTLLSVSTETKRKFTARWEHWKGNPRELVATFRRLADRQREVVRISSGLRFDDEFDQLASELYVMMMSGDDIGAGAWSLLFQDGLHSVYLDILLGSGYGIWGETYDAKALLVDLLGGLAYCVRQAATSPPDTTRDIVHRVPNLLEILWKRRELINLSVLNEYGLVPYNEPMPEQNIVELVVFFRYAHSKMCGAAPTPETYAPQLGAYFWTRIDRRESGIIQCLDALIFLTQRTPMAKLEKFAKDVLIDTIGADKFIDRANQELQCVDLPPSLTATLIRVLNILHEAPCMQLYLRANPSFSYAVVATSRIAADPKSSARIRASVSTATLSFLSTLVKVRSTKYRGADVFELMTLCIDLLLAGHDYASFSNADRDVVKDTVQHLAMRTLDVGEGNAAVDQAKVLADLNEAAMHMWWPGLQRLQTAQHRAGLQGPYGELIKWWTRWGAGLGLKEEIERARFQEKVLHHCSWKDCEFFATRKESRADLRACTGCQQNRYCDRECQLNDWTKGGHKKACKRLKK